MAKKESNKNAEIVKKEATINPTKKTTKKDTKKIKNENIVKSSKKTTRKNVEKKEKKDTNKPVKNTTKKQVKKVVKNDVVKETKVEKEQVIKTEGKTTEKIISTNVKKKNKCQDKKKLVLLLLLVVIIIALLISASYAYFFKQLSGSKQQIVTAGDITLILNEGNDLSQILASINYPVKDEVGMTSNEFTFSIENPNSNDVVYRLYLVDDSLSENKVRVTDSNIKYYLTKNGEGMGPALLSTLTNDFTGRLIESGTISKKTTNNYTLRFWLDYNSGNEVMGQEFSVKLFLVAEQPLSTVPISEFMFQSEYMGDNCKTYDDGIDTFLVGQCSQNYVWYSGKLWRIVLKNNATEKVKMITEDQITVIPYSSSGKSTFENSFADQWLNQEFLPTLHDYEDYLVLDNIWDSTLIASDYTSRPPGTTTVNRAVGLLNAYEHTVPYNHSDGLATSATSYLRTDVYWNLMTPSTADRVRTVDQNGSQANSAIIYGNGIRPVVYLKPGIEIASGKGTLADPYILKREAPIVNGNTLLSTRYSGEYITFNNELYRIVNVEDGLTKIVAESLPIGLPTSIKYHSGTGYNTDYGTASINAYLDTYYDGIDTYWKSMIEPNTTWYTGRFGDGASYKLSICASDDTNISTYDCERTSSKTENSIGLPRVGEMFTSQISRTGKENYWTLTPYDDYYVRFIGNLGDLYDAYTTSSYYLRTSFYLKKNVKIASNNTGNGTYEKPYSIEFVMPYGVHEDFEDEEVDSNLTITNGEIENGVLSNFTSVSFTPTSDAKLSFKYFADATRGGTLIIKLTTDSQVTELFNGSLTASGNIENISLKANTTYTITYDLSGVGNQTYFIDNLVIE